VFFELDARVLEQVDGVLGVHVLRQVELEVELPGGGTAFRQLSLVVQEGQPQLDDLQEVDVASQELVLVVGGGFELAWNAELTDLKKKAFNKKLISNLLSFALLRKKLSKYSESRIVNLTVIWDLDNLITSTKW